MVVVLETVRAGKSRVFIMENPKSSISFLNFWKEEEKQ